MYQLLLQHPAADQYDTSSLKRCTISAAPVTDELYRAFTTKFNCKMYEGYGLTEASPTVALCRPSMPWKKGSTGVPIDGVEIKILDLDDNQLPAGEQGEIVVKGPNVMLGYYKMEEETAKVFDSEGYLLTGDVGEYDHDGYLSITGRAKDQFKTDKGKYISPAPMELALVKNSDIDQVCIVGMGIPQPIMLVIASEKGKKKSKEELRESLLNSILEINPTLEKHEKIEKAVVMKEDWTVDNGLMTPTMKIKRSQVEKIHRHMYRAWFDAPERVIYE